MSNQKGTISRAKYSFYGFLFGLCFPLIGYFILQHNDNSLSPEKAVENNLFQIILLAPFVLAVVAYFVSANVIKLIRDLVNERNKEQEIIGETIEFINAIGNDTAHQRNLDVTKNERLFGSLLQMRDNLAVAAKLDDERAWLNSAETEVGDILRIYNEVLPLAENINSYLSKKLGVVQCAFYTFDEESDDQLVSLIASFAYNRKKRLSPTFKLGQGLVGQAMIEQVTIYRTEIPDTYATITSGLLGVKKPSAIIIVPLITNEKVYGAIEIASVNEIPKLHIQFLNQVSDKIARTIFNISVNEKTLRLLTESRKMADELQLQREQLLQNAEEMKITQEELSRSNIQLEKQINEVNNSQKRMHTLLENASELIVVFDTAQTIKYISPSVKNILGFNDVEVLGQKNFINLNEKARGDFDENFLEILNNPDHTVKLEFSVQSKGGQRIWLEALGQNKLQDSSIEGIVFNCRDITMRRKAEKEEKRSGQMQALSENSIDLIIRINEEGRFYYVNPTISKFTGLHAGELVNQTIDQVSLHPKIVEFLKATTAELYQTQHKTHSELTYTNESGKYTFSVASIPEFGSDGQVDTILMVFHDVTEQKEIENQIKEKNKSITESINYSYNIQSSLMPSESVIRNYFPNSFLYYAPKDIVSGDFPWLYVTDQAIYIATVDCTGHGVPGALMSFIGYFTLNNILAKNNNLNCGELLDLMHAEVQRVLRQDVADSKSRDGMDVALCKYYPSTQKLEFSGAHRPLYLLQQGVFAEIKADKYPIAGMHYKNRTNFVNNELQLQKGDSFYIFTDGFPDQFGGPTGKEKLYSTRIQEHIATHANLEMNDMGESFDELFTTWKGNNKQLDDVLMIGVKV